MGIGLISKLFNDKLFSNRLFAYLLNVSIREFNKMELEIIKRLGFHISIDEEMYRIYEDEIQAFSLNKSQILMESLQEYRINKKNIREYSRIARKNLVKVNGIKNEETKYSNDFGDMSISGFIEKKKHGDLSGNQPYYIPGFRFESYNSHDFKSVPAFSKFGRSLSEKNDEE